MKRISSDRRQNLIGQKFFEQQLFIAYALVLAVGDQLQFILTFELSSGDLFLPEVQS